MYRKSREDIAAFLPEVSRIDMPVGLYPKTQKLYDFIKDDLLTVIEDMLESGESGGFDVAAHYGEGDSASNRMKGEVMSRITAMRLLISHPSLLLRSAESYEDESTVIGSKYASFLKQEGGLVMDEGSWKLDTLMGYIEELGEERPDYKLVIFSGFKQMLSIIGTELQNRKIGFTSMTGDTSADIRFERMTRFNTKPGCKVFLSSDAGAYGINLDAGTHLINYDLPWSAGALDQRVARIDRTSSKNSHIDTVYMYAHDTVEQYQYEMLKEKSKVAKAFVDGEGYDAAGKLDLELSSLRQFLLR